MTCIGPLNWSHLYNTRCAGGASSAWNTESKIKSYSL